MPDVVSPCCWICAPKYFPKRFEMDFGGCVLASYWMRLRVKCKNRVNILGPDWGQAWPSWALLRYLEAVALLLAAKLGNLQGKLGYRGVMLELSWVMSCYNELYVVQLCSCFCIQKCSPQQDQDFKFVSASYVGSIWGSTAILWLCCAVGTILG